MKKMHLSEGSCTSKSEDTEYRRKMMVTGTSTCQKCQKLGQNVRIYVRKDTR